MKLAHARMTHHHQGYQHYQGHHQQDHHHQTKRINTITNFIIKDGRVGVLIGGVGLQGFSGNFLDALASLEWDMPLRG